MQRLIIHLNYPFDEDKWRRRYLSLTIFVDYSVKEVTDSDMVGKTKKKYLSF